MSEPSCAPGESAPLLQTLQRPGSRPGDSSGACATATVLNIAPEIAASPSPSPSSSSSNNSSPLLGTCRICFESETADSQDPSNPLICPCLCSGSSKFVHRHCLKQWRTTNHRADASYQCEVCKYRYQYRRLWWAGLLGSPVTLVTLYLLLMSALIAVLGFIPVLNLLPSSKRGSSSGSGDSGGGGSPAPGGEGGGSAQSVWLLVSLHIANGLIMMGIVGLFVSLVVGMLRACGAASVAFLPDPLCPMCWGCCEGNAGMGGVPFIDCAGCAGAGECGLVLLVVLVVVLLVAGITAAAYMLYAVLWALVQQGLDKAQSMVENVQQERQEQELPAGAGAAAACDGVVVK